tara:strand:- start:718 stop:885 length:168 start_codon:yes stop_codon:yes gene_type:complete
MVKKYLECLDKNVKLNLEICQYIMDITSLEMERDRLKEENTKLKKYLNGRKEEEK